MQLSEIMTKKVEVLDSKSSLFEAARKMKDCNIGTVLVQEGEKLVGILTDRDIVTRALAMGADPSREKVGNIMSSPVVFGFENQTLEDASHIMEEKGVRRLPILNRQKKLVGLVSLSDVAVNSNYKYLAGSVLDTVSHASVY